LFARVARLRTRDGRGMKKELSALCLALGCSFFSSQAIAQNDAIYKAPAAPLAKSIEPSPAFNFALDGSLPAQIDNNVTRVTHNEITDFNYSPFLKLSAIAALRPDLTYSIYADTNVNRYLQYFNNNGSTAGVGTQLVKKWDGLQLGALYDWSQFYDRDFRERFGANNDFGVFLRYYYATPDTKLRIKPNLAMTSRFDNELSIQRYLYSFKVDFEYKFMDRWSAIVTPRVRYYDYVGLQAGRRDLVYSVSTGLRHNITDDLDFTTTVGYENRVSNLPGKDYNDLTIGASLDFSFTLFRSKAAPGSDFLQWLSH
jgi:Putative beta-barrel porin 2